MKKSRSYPDEAFVSPPNETNKNGSSKQDACCGVGVTRPTTRAFSSPCREAFESFLVGGGPVDCLCVFFIAALLLFSGFVRLQRVCESEL